MELSSELSEDDLKEEISNIVDEIMENNETLKQMREFKDLVTLYANMEDKEEGEVEAEVINKIIEKLEGVIPSELLNLTFNKVILGSKTNHIDWNYTYELPSIKAYVDFEIVFTQIIRQHVKLYFEAKSTINAEGEIHSEEGSKYAEIRKMGIKIELWLTLKMILGQKKRKVGEKEFYIEKIRLGSP